MPIHCECLQCGYRGIADDAYAGEILACPQCGQGIAVPSLPAAPHFGEPASPPQLRRSHTSASPVFLLMFLAGIVGFGSLLVIVAMVVGARFRGPIQEKASTSSAKAEIQQLETELLEYSYARGRFPTSDQGLEVLLDKSWGRPSHQGPLPLDPWGQPYQYEYPGFHNEMRPDVWSMGPDMTDGTDDDIVNWDASDSLGRGGDESQVSPAETETPNRTRMF